MHVVSKKDLHSAELETRPSARCKPEKKRRYVSSNWTYSSKLCFVKKLPQFFPWENSARIMGIHTTGSAVKNHISSKRARKLIAKNQTMCHSLSLVYQRVLPQPHPHLLPRHLHHRTLYLTSADTRKNPQPKQVEG